MKKNNHYIELENKFEKISHLNNLLGIIHWDYAVNIPKSSASSRQKEISTLSSTAHDLLTSEDTGLLISQAEESSANLDEWQNANVREIKRRFLHANCISKELEAKITEATAECEYIWRTARRDNDFASFATYLQKVLDLTRESANVKSQHFGVAPYDILIDQYDPERKSSEIRASYDILKQELPVILKKITAKQSGEEILTLPIMSVAHQKIISKKLMEHMGFDFDRGRLDESSHPFCGGATNDVRLTTRYNESDFLSGLLGVVHETGHALYEQNLPNKYRSQEVGRAKGMAFHESQSLIMECQIAKSMEFAEFLSKLLRDELNLLGNEYSAQNLYKTLTKVQPSFIRVEADEVTYPLHVIMRFEIEESLIAGDIEVKDIPAVWNEKMRKYLGIIPKTDSDGCMQDIHWAWGAFGYFPSYTNGAIIASMMMNKAELTNSSIMSDVREGDFSSINSFLTENFRKFGSLKNSCELLTQSTNHSEIKPTIFLEYLTKKYLA